MGKIAPRGLRLRLKGSQGGTHARSVAGDRKPPRGAANRDAWSPPSDPLFFAPAGRSLDDPHMGEYRYGVVGSGRQGTAAAYDLIVRGEAASVVLGDLDWDAARSAAERVNRLSGVDRATAARVDASDRSSLAEFLSPLDAFVSSASYRFNVGVAQAAIEAGTHMCDLGGNLQIV